MPANIGDLHGGILSRIQDDAKKLTTTPALTCDVDLAIASALEEFSGLKSYEVTIQLPGSGTGQFEYATTLLTVTLTGSSPAAWIDGFSNVTKLCYPYVVNDQNPNYQPPDEWSIRSLPSGTVVHFAQIAPNASEVFLISFTTKHVVNATDFTIPSAFVEAFEDLGAAYCCQKLASKYIQSARAAVQADAVQYITKAKEYRDQKEDFRKSFRAKLFAPPDAVVGPAQAVGSIDQAFGNKVDRYFFNGRNMR